MSSLSVDPDFVRNTSACTYAGDELAAAAHAVNISADRELPTKDALPPEPSAGRAEDGKRKLGWATKNIVTRRDSHDLSGVLEKPSLPF